MDVLYTAHATASGGGREDGRSATDDGKIDVTGKAGTPVGPDTKVTASVGFGKNTRGEGFNLDIELAVSDTGLDQAVAQKLVETAHTVCPYSNATCGNVDVRLSAA